MSEPPVPIYVVLGLEPRALCMLGTHTFYQLQPKVTQLAPFKSEEYNLEKSVLLRPISH